MDVFQIEVLAAGAVLLLIIIIFLSRRNRGADEADGNNAVRPRVPAPRAEGAAIPARAAARRRGGRNRLAAGRQDSDDEEEEPMFDHVALPEGKVGAKKMKKLEAKEEKKQMREAELQDREERKKREALLDEKRKKEDQREKELEAEMQEEEKKRKEEEEQREHEEYLKLKESFVVEEEGTDKNALEEDGASLLQEFIDYIIQMKVVMLEDLAGHFGLKVQEAVDRINDLQNDGRLLGIMDDRGKFIYITQEELEAVVKFIKQRGRVSITELAESSNNLINLSPDNQKVFQEMVGGTKEELSTS